MEGVLAGFRVLDFGRYIAGPYCAALLADLGADVIRIERRGGGEDRWVAPVGPDGVGAMFLVMNRNKRAMSLDPASPEGREIVKKLVATADVVVANLPPEVLRSLALDLDSLRAVKPDIILTTVTAFGAGGPWSHKHGFDGIGQVMSGSAYLTGTPGSAAARGGALGRLRHGLARRLRDARRAHEPPEDRTRPEGGRGAPAHRGGLQQSHAGRAAGHRGRPHRHRQSRPDLGALGSLPDQGRLDHRVRHRQSDVQALGQAARRGRVAHRPALQGRRVARQPRRAHLEARVGMDRRAHHRRGAGRARVGEDPRGAALLAPPGPRGRAHPRRGPPDRHRVSRVCRARSRWRRPPSICRRPRAASAIARPRSTSTPTPSSASSATTAQPSPASAPAA